jgi:hypothetical protein
MRWLSGTRPHVLFAMLCAGGAALILAAGSFRTARADAGPALRANSVCEAQRLKAQKAADPSLEIEIPAEFDKAFPTILACESHDAAWDESAPGPQQPIPFSHKHHAGEYQIDCLYCHSGTERSRAAGVPSVELCMGCHAQFPAEYDQLEGIKILKGYWERKEPIPWVQIHRLPEHVKFQHQRHVNQGIACQTCHGPVEDIEKLYLVPDTKWWPWALPTHKLEMGWCVQCHRQNEASQDCATCHY